MTALVNELLPVLMLTLALFIGCVVVTGVIMVLVGFLVRLSERMQSDTAAAAVLLLPILFLASLFAACMGIATLGLPQ